VVLSLYTNTMTIRTSLAYCMGDSCFSRARIGEIAGRCAGHCRLHDCELCWGGRLEQLGPVTLGLAHLTNYPV